MNSNIPTSLVDKLFDACDMAMNGGGGDPPDHTIWATADVIKAIKNEGYQFTPEQQKRIDEWIEDCKQQGEEMDL